MNLTKQLKMFLMPFAGKFIIAYILVMAQCIAKILQPKTTNLIIDKALSGRDLGALYRYVFAFLLIFLLGELCRIVQTMLFVNISENMTLSLRRKFYKAITRMSIVDVRKRVSGDIVSRMIGELSSITTFYTQTIPNIIINILVLVFGIMMMGGINKLCTFITVTVLPLIYITAKYFTPQIKHLTKEGAEINAQFVSLIEQIVNNIVIIKHRYDYSYIDSGFEFSSNKIKNNKYDITKYSLTVSTLLTLIAFIPNSFIMIWGGHMVLSERMTIGTLIALNSYAGYLISPVIFFAQSAISYHQNNVFTSRYDEIIREYLVHDEITSSKEKIVNFRNLSFHNVSFSYGDKLIVNKLNFEVNPGDVVQIYGRNGTGKTTVINLITGLLKPGNGTIAINNKSIDQLNLDGLICVVPQESYLFDDTIENNILLGRDSLKDKFIVVAKELAFDEILYEKILKTGINSNRNNISGGQAQKINILRALTLDCPIVIFDEADTYLDATSKQAVYRYINSHKEKTFIIICHETLESISPNKIINLNCDCFSRDTVNSFAQI